MNEFSAIKNNIAIINLFIGMKLIMKSFMRKCYKLLRAVIVLCSFVMDNFCRKKIATYNFFYHKAVFKDITVYHGKGMFRHKNQNISATISFIFFKTRMILSRAFRKFFSNIPSRFSFERFRITFMRTVLPFLAFFRIKRMSTNKTINIASGQSGRSFLSRFPITIRGTIFLFCMSSRIKYFITIFTRNIFSCFSHIDLQIKKAVFRSLSETQLRVSTLLTAVNTNKNTAFPIEKIIIA
mgnify:CR=1 FL=1